MPKRKSLTSLLGVDGVYFNNSYIYKAESIDTVVRLHDHDGYYSVIAFKNSRAVKRSHVKFPKPKKPDFSECYNQEQVDMLKAEYNKKNNPQRYRAVRYFRSLRKRLGVV